MRVGCVPVQADLEAATQGKSVDRCDHWLLASSPTQSAKASSRHTQTLLVASAPVSLLDQISAGAEGFVTFAGNNGYCQRGLIVQPVEDCLSLQVSLKVDRVHLLWSVDSGEHHPRAGKREFVDHGLGWWSVP